MTTRIHQAIRMTKNPPIAKLPLNRLICLQKSRHDQHERDPALFCTSTASKKGHSSFFIERPKAELHVLTVAEKRTELIES
jgi:hypothetical protein